MKSKATQSDASTSLASKDIICNLRGINNKQQWLNQPLDSLELHVKSCRTLVDADLWMNPGTEIIHFSSLLCNLIRRYQVVGRYLRRTGKLSQALYSKQITSGNDFDC